MDDALGQVEAQLQEMGQRVLSAVRGATRALQDRDRELADEVIAFDDEVDRHFLEIEQQIQSLLALQTPVARDLRLLLAIIHINLLLERTGDGCVTIAKLSKLVADIEPDPALADVLTEMAERAEEMVRVALNSFNERDLAGAESLVELDELIDRANRRFVERLVDVMADPRVARVGPAHGRRRADDRADRRPRRRHRRADRLSPHGRVPRVHRRLTSGRLGTLRMAA